MNKQARLRLFILPMLVIVLALVNYSRLSGTENVRAIHVVTLVTIGMGIGVLLRNVFTYFRQKGGDTSVNP